MYAHVHGPAPPLAPGCGATATRLRRRGCGTRSPAVLGPPSGMLLRHGARAADGRGERLLLRGFCRLAVPCLRGAPQQRTAARHGGAGGRRQHLVHIKVVRLVRQRPLVMLLLRCVRHQLLLLHLRSVRRRLVMLLERRHVLRNARNKAVGRVLHQLAGAGDGKGRPQVPRDSVAAALARARRGLPLRRPQLRGPRRLPRHRLYQQPHLLLQLRLIIGLACTATATTARRAAVVGVMQDLALGRSALVARHRTTAAVHGKPDAGPPRLLLLLLLPAQPRLLLLPGEPQALLRLLLPPGARPPGAALLRALLLLPCSRRGVVVAPRAAACPAKPGPASTARLLPPSLIAATAVPFPFNCACCVAIPKPRWPLVPRLHGRLHVEVNTQQAAQLGGAEGGGGARGGGLRGHLRLALRGACLAGGQLRLKPPHLHAGAHARLDAVLGRPSSLFMALKELVAHRPRLCSRRARSAASTASPSDSSAPSTSSRASKRAASATADSSSAAHARCAVACSALSRCAAGDGGGWAAEGTVAASSAACGRAVALVAGDARGELLAQASSMWLPPPSETAAPPAAGGRVGPARRGPAVARGRLPLRPLEPGWLPAPVERAASASSRSALHDASSPSRRLRRRQRTRGRAGGVGFSPSSSAAARAGAALGPALGFSERTAGSRPRVDLSRARGGAGQQGVPGQVGEKPAEGDAAAA
ncbi:hypothetical protein TSOC_001039 [Tetrabaena socialis]|uniref:Uncharacterized protein n=1 Tax=Tetrabaena socialis TaxID=47790 RepID=A0A2J8AHY2_9CHLO|nr:hypothetical protein TSOC_001039 [Tetrabaena socialis]|eukprot:PNH12122.1 hypothetical protein TSOC_001039 [Tetrabaena socialis]